MMLCSPITTTAGDLLSFCRERAGKGHSRTLADADERCRLENSLILTLTDASGRVPPARSSGGCERTVRPFVRPFKPTFSRFTPSAIQQIVVLRR